MGSGQFNSVEMLLSALSCEALVHEPRWNVWPLRCALQPVFPFRPGNKTLECPQYSGLLRQIQILAEAPCRLQPLAKDHSFKILAGLDALRFRYYSFGFITKGTPVASVGVSSLSQTIPHTSHNGIAFDIMNSYALTTSDAVGRVL